MPVEPFVFDDKVTPIAPYTLETCAARIRQKVLRFAWIIPIRGISPWEGASPASILADDGASSNTGPDLPSPSNKDGFPDIIWTRAAVSAFWDFLQTVRATGNHGAIGLSFHAARPIGPHSTTDDTLDTWARVGSHKLTTQTGSTSDTSAEQDVETYAGRRPKLDETDHFVVFHDVAYSWAIQTLLRLWSYREGEAKIRLLKGARLALLDNIGRGMLIC